MSAKLGVGVIGVGILGSRHARVYQEQDATQLLAIADSAQKKCDEVGAKLNDRAYADHRAMIDALGPKGSGEMGAVTVSTPDFAHFEIVRDCLAGVMCSWRNRSRWIRGRRARWLPSSCGITGLSRREAPE